MNIAESFATYMQDSLLLGTLGDTIRIGGIAQDAPTTCWWVVLSGGTPQPANSTGELKKNYVLDVYYRAMDQKTVYDALSSLEETVNSGNCTQLSDFDTIDIRATLFATDQDIDNEERTVGLLQVTITTYYKE